MDHPPKLARLLARGRTLRVIGFDDAPFRKRRGGAARVVGVVCANTRFEGMVCSRVRQDGFGATDALCRMLLHGKFLPQLHLVLLDGIALGGFNIVDLPGLCQRLRLPCVAVMRRPPDMEQVEWALSRLSLPERRLALLRAAGPIYHRPPFAFQVAGESPDVIEQVLHRLTDTGHVPEALRLAHLIGSAIILGESGRRA